VETGVDQISISGRHRRTTSEEELARRYHIPIPQQRDLPISWDMAPTEDVLAIRFNPESKQRTLDVVCLQELKAPDAAFPINDIHAAGYGAIWHWQSTFSGGTFLHWFRCTTPTLGFPVVPIRFWRSSVEIFGTERLAERFSRRGLFTILGSLEPRARSGGRREIRMHNGAGSRNEHALV
jgi:hypothetical protein